jgi:hypothetical protein
VSFATRWVFRWRCGLCTPCGFPAGKHTLCAECGRTIRPWPEGGRPIRAYAPRLLRRLVLYCIAAIVAAALCYTASGWASIYIKGPRGVYGAIWHGQCALGRSGTPFATLGLETAPHDGGYRLLFRVPGQLEGLWICLPLWLPVPGLALVGLMGWWHGAVRRGLSLHWPAPATSGEPAPQPGAPSRSRAPARGP